MPGRDVLNTVCAGRHSNCNAQPAACAHPCIRGWYQTSICKSLKEFIMHFVNMSFEAMKVLFTFGVLHLRIWPNGLCILPSSHFGCLKDRFSKTGSVAEIQPELIAVVFNSLLVIHQSSCCTKVILSFKNTLRLDFTCKKN